MASRTELIFNLGEESYPTVISDNNLSASPFLEVIALAEDRINEISQQLLDINRKSNVGNTVSAESWKKSTPNNIIAFLGDRGTGKTSCMRTVVRNLGEIHRDWMYIDEIDPSFFDKNHNVLEILIGILYGEFKEKAKDWDNKRLRDKHALIQVQEQFKELKSTLKYLEDTPDLEDEYEIDALEHLNSGGKIRSLIKELVDGMLSLYDKRMLVVGIDDLDINVEQSYEMMEHIRKYLSVPNLLVVVAAKFDQLFDSICLNLSKVYKDISHRVSSKDIAEMTERYLSKLLPFDQRFEMPSTESYMDASFRIVDEEGRKIYEAETVLLGLPSLIFEKTRYLFYNSSGMPSLVIPRNLRDLRMLASMLGRMGSFAESEKTNKRIFKEYFFEEWLRKIDPDYRIFAKGLLEEENIAKINHYVISNLYKFFLSKTETYSKLEEDLKITEKEKTDNSVIRQRQLLRNILNPANSYWNISIGDVVVVINAVKKTMDSAKMLYLLFFIESFYSIKLYETYDKMTDMTDKDGLKLKVDTQDTAPELKTSVRGEIPEYFRLAGGSFFSLSQDSFIPFSGGSNKKEPRETRLINGKILMDEIRKIENEYESLFKKSSSSKNVKIPDQLTARLRLCEFLMLTIKSRINLNEKHKNIRLLNEPVYFKGFSASTKNLIFDISKPFFNAVYPQWAYGRFGTDIFKWAKKDPLSVLNKMIGLKSRNKRNDTWELMSKAAIRNMEILEDITAWLYGRRETDRLSSSNDLDAIIDFYSQFDFKESKNSIPVGKYCVKTYGKASSEGKKSFYYIDYSIYSELGVVLKELKYDGNDNKKQTQIKERMDFFRDVFNYSALFLQKEMYTNAEIFEALKPYCTSYILCTYFKEGSEDIITGNEVAERLAELRIGHGYEFNGKLPVGIQFYYTNHVDRIYKNKKNELDVRKSRLEEQHKNKQNEIDNIEEIYKQQSKELKQYYIDSKKLRTENLKLNAKINEIGANLKYFEEQLLKETIKTEILRIKKENEKLAKSLNSANADLGLNIQLIHSCDQDTKKALESISSNEQKLNDNLKDIKKIEQDLRDIERESRELDNIWANPILID